MYELVKDYKGRAEALRKTLEQSDADLRMARKHLRLAKRTNEELHREYVAALENWAEQQHEYNQQLKRTVDKIEVESGRVILMGKE